MLANINQFSTNAKETHARGTRYQGYVRTWQLGQAKIRAWIQETLLQSESDRWLELTARPREGSTECALLQAPIQAYQADSRPRMMSGRRKDKRNGRHTIQTSSPWLHRGRRGLLPKYTQVSIRSRYRTGTQLNHGNELYSRIITSMSVWLHPLRSWAWLCTSSHLPQPKAITPFSSLNTQSTWKQTWEYEMRIQR
jgi:hypothetical protein